MLLVDFLLVIRVRVAWGQMQMCQLLPLFHCAGVCACVCLHLSIGESEGVGWWCWGENKHIFRYLSFVSTQVRPSACWDVRLYHMATQTQTLRCPAQTVPHLWLAAETRRSAPELPMSSL